MTDAIRIVDMLSADHQLHAAQLVFEYLAATQAEACRPVPASIGQLPAVLRAECQNLATVYQAPGTFLLAYDGEQPIACAPATTVADPWPC